MAEIPKCSKCGLPMVKRHVDAYQESEYWCRMCDRPLFPWVVCDAWHDYSKPGAPRVVHAQNSECVNPRYVQD